jgi:HAD superfamily hydrolase (TIGR01509 family)
MSKQLTNLPSALFFDMDGLLVDTEPLWLASEREIMARFSVEWSHEDQIHCLGGPMERVGRYMAERAKNPQPWEWFTHELIDIMEGKLRRIELMPGLVPLLREISDLGISTALVSASPRRIVDGVLSTIASHPFQFSISADDVERSKPHPDPYIEAARRLNIAIEDALIIEDSPTGVRAARSSGAWVIAVPQLTPIEPAPKSAVISTLEGHTLNSLWSLVRASTN